MALERETDQALDELAVGRLRRSTVGL